MLTLTKAGASGTEMPIGDAGISAVLGYVVVFIGIALLLIVCVIVGKIMVSRSKQSAPAAAKEQPAAPAAPAPVPEKPRGPVAPGSAGEVKLYDTPPKTAAMIMAIVADKMGKPLNELRFISIKEVK